MKRTLSKTQIDRLGDRLRQGMTASDMVAGSENDANPENSTAWKAFVAQFLTDAIAGLEGRGQ